MSDFGTLMDRIVVAAEAAVTGLTAERDHNLVSKLNTEDFPHLFVFDASQVSERRPHQQTITDTRILCRLITRGETQEAFLLKLDLVAAGILADAPLLSSSTDLSIESIETLEDPKSVDRFAEIVVLIQQES